MVWHRARMLATVAPQIERCHVIIERLTRQGEAAPRFRVSLLLSGSASLLESAPSQNVTTLDIHTGLRDLFAQARRRFARRWLLPRPGAARLTVQH